MRATDKLSDAFTQLLEAFNELRQHLNSELGSVEEAPIAEDETKEANPELEAALVTEVRGAIEVALEGADVSPEDFGEVVAAMTEALEEIDPDIFEVADDSEYDDDDLDDDIEDDDDLDEYDDLDEDYEDLDNDDENYQEQEEVEEDDTSKKGKKKK